MKNSSSRAYQLLSELEKKSLTLEEMSSILNIESSNKILTILCASMKLYIGELKGIENIEDETFLTNFFITIKSVIEQCERANLGETLKSIQDMSKRCCKLSKTIQDGILPKYLEEIETMLVEKLDVQYQNNHYDFISYLVYEVKSLTYLRQVLSAKPYYVNAKNKEGKHILLELIDKYMNEFRLKGNSRNLSYYSSAIFTFMNASRFHLSSKDIDAYKEIIKTNLVRLEEEKSSSRTIGFYKEILSILDKKQMNQEVIADINREFGIHMVFSFDTQQEIQSFSKKPYIITIDDIATLDMDDAISITKDGDCYHLHIYISDVASVIQPGTALDREAYKRMETLYFSNPIIPMFPVELSNDILSLNTNGYKPVIEIAIDIYENGDIGTPKIRQNHIRINKKCSYPEVNKIIEKGSTNPDLNQTIKLLNEMANILSKQNDRSTYREIKDIKNASYGIERHRTKYTDRTKAEIIIEEVMVLFNSEVARFFALKGYPCLYRVHPLPDATEEYTSLLRLREFIKENYENEQDYTKIANNLLGMYPQAYYSIFNIGHFGLSKDYYCHATSPIRRYPDIILQRLIYDYIFTEPTRDKDQIWIPKLMEMCDYCNERMDENIQYQIRMQYVQSK